jgi:hypothetical protein
MFEALRCIFVPYRPRAIEDRLLGLPAEEPALDDFGSKLTLARMSTHFAEGFAHHLHPPPIVDGRDRRGRGFDLACQCTIDGKQAVSRSFRELWGWPCA